jgi:CRISPR/Cas system-associated endonuclease Cas1
MKLWWSNSGRLREATNAALLNFLYGILESKARFAAVAMGLDPAIGLLHMDTPNRDSLACDLMEVCRPRGVEAFLLNWLQSEPLRRPDFWEDRNRELPHRVIVGQQALGDFGHLAADEWLRWQNMSNIQCRWC